MPRPIDANTVLVETSRPADLALLTGGTAGTNEVTMEWTQRNAETCAVFGASPVSPILRDYEFPGRFRPMEHQIRDANYLASYKRYYLLAEMGTGKTATCIWVMNYLMRIGSVNRVLIVAPLTILETAWADEIDKLIIGQKYSVLHGSTKTKKALDDSPIHIVNYDGVTSMLKILARNQYDLIIIDEARTYANPSTTRWKAMHSLIDRGTRVWMLTGTPTSHSPVDAFGQAKLATPHNVPKYKGAFQALVQRKVDMFRWVNKPDCWNVVVKALAPASVTFKRDVMDLPPVTRVYKHVPMSPQQHAYFHEMDKNSMIDHGQIRIIAETASVKHIKLLQIASGAVYDMEDRVVEFDISGKIKETLSIIEESIGAVLVFVPFKHTIGALEPHLLPLGFRVIHGDIPIAERRDIINLLQDGQIRGILAIPSTMSHGVTATAATTTIWFSPVASSDTYIQACNRMDRPGQKNAMTIVHLFGASIERDMYTRLLEKKAGQETMLHEYDDYIQGD